MTNIDDLKSDWKSQQMPEFIAAKKTGFSSVAQEFKKVQRKTKLENIACSILFVITIVILWVMTWFMDDPSWWVYSGVSVLTVEMVLATGFMWYRNSLKKWGHLQRDNYSYISTAVKKLKYRKFLAHYVIPVYAALLIIAINLVYIDVLSDISLIMRGVIHGGVSILLAGFVAFEIKKRLKKERQEIDPMIRELEVMKEGLEQ